MTLAARLLRHPFIRFGIVGAAGYVVDAAILALNTGPGHMAFEPARAISIFCAMCVTWAGNRYLTFPDRRAHGIAGMAREWMTFVGANLVGAVVNYAASVALVHWAPAPISNHFVAQALGVLAGLVFNFTLSAKLVFRR